MKCLTRRAARLDIAHEFSRYLELGLSDVAIRFRASVEAGIRAVMSTPLAGSPRSLRNPRLTGLRTWPVKGFSEFRIYYLADSDAITIIRVLHGKRDIGRILEAETFEP